MALLLAGTLLAGCRTPPSGDLTALAALHHVNTWLFGRGESIEWLMERPEDREEFIRPLEDHLDETRRLCLKLIELDSPYDFAAAEWLRFRHPDLWNAIPKGRLAGIYVDRFRKTLSSDNWMTLDLNDKKYFQVHPAAERLVGLGRPAIRPLYWNTDDRTELGSAESGISNAIFKVRRCDLAASMILLILRRDPSTLPADPVLRDDEIERLRKEVRRLKDVWDDRELKSFLEDEQSRKNRVGPPINLDDIGDAQNRFREDDVDRNTIKDYWVGDVSGLYRFLLNGKPIRMIFFDLSQADAAPLDLPGLLPAPRWPVPSDGYVLAALKKYEDKGREAAYDDGSHRNPSRYGIGAYPAEYPKTGTFSFITNQTRLIYRKDTGGKPPDLFPEDPLKAGWEKVD